MSLQRGFLWPFYLKSFFIALLYHSSSLFILFTVLITMYNYIFIYVLAYFLSPPPKRSMSRNGVEYQDQVQCMQHRKHSNICCMNKRNHCMAMSYYFLSVLICVIHPTPIKCPRVVSLIPGFRIQTESLSSRSS